MLRLGIRHAPLDSGGYADEKDVDKAVSFLVTDRQERVYLKSRVPGLLARGIYKHNLQTECLAALGYTAVGENMAAIAGSIRQ